MSRTQRARRGLQLWSLCAALAGFSACEETRSDPQPSSDSVLSLSQSLQGAVASCAENARSCEADGGASCRDDFETCRDTATESAKPGIEAAVNACAAEAKSCRDAATSDDAKAACRDQLRACVGDQKPDAGDQPAQPDKPDAGSKSPVASCISALHTCLEGDEKARVCTEALQQCIADSVGHNGQGTPPDADAGKPGNDRDAGPAKPDAAQGDKPDAAQGDRPDAAQGGGKPDDKPDAAQGGGKPDDAGMSGAEPDAGAADSSKECKAAREACLANGDDKEACARMLRMCRDR
ncbi:MAG TPA: hypothetical protein VFZ61_05600 [Polyangiales bacterium]